MVAVALVAVVVQNHPVVVVGVVERIHLVLVVPVAQSLPRPEVVQIPHRVVVRVVVVVQSVVDWGEEDNQTL